MTRHRINAKYIFPIAFSDYVLNPFGVVANIFTNSQLAVSATHRWSGGLVGGLPFKLQAEVDVGHVAHVQRP